MDGTVVAIDTGYNSQGLVGTITSLGASNVVLNQVVNAYNGFGQLTAQYQQHDGAVNGSTLTVQYAYSSAAHGSRLVSMTYPDGNVLNYNYGPTGGLNDVISRLASLSEGTATLESCRYLGLSAVVERDEGSGVNLTYIGSSAGGDAGDIYTGLDRFGRVIDQKWTTGSNGSSGTVKDEYTYAYDADGNVLSKVNTQNTALDETYTYDALNRLTAVNSSTGSLSQSFGLNAVGDINSVTTNGVQTNRTSNSLNQLTSVGTATLTYDNNGAMTTDDQGHTLVYDAWGRLVKVKNGSTVVQSFAYDGAGRLVTAADGSANRTDSYFSGTQDVETRNGVSSSSNGTVAADNVFSPVYVNAILARDSGGNRVYFTHDANYNVTAVISTAGAVLQRQSYTAYGVVTFRHADGSAIAGNVDGYGLTRLYQGMLYNGATGWYFSGQSNVGRWYSPTAMTWTKGDQGYVDGLSLYQFVRSNPIHYNDPTGRGFWSWVSRTGVGVIAGAAAGAVTGLVAGAVVGAVTGAGVGAIPGMIAGMAAGAIAGGIAAGVADAGHELAAGGPISYGDAAEAGAISGGAAGISGGLSGAAGLPGAVEAAGGELSAAQNIAIATASNASSGAVSAGIASHGDPLATGLGAAQGALWGAIGGAAGEEYGNGWTGTVVNGVTAGDAEAIGGIIGENMRVPCH